MNEHDSELSRDELLARYGKKSVAATLDAKRRSPFKFLDSYGLEDADIFFGRDAEIEELLRLYHGFGHILIYGESGSGKSSLVQCGLRSRIPQEDALFVPLRVHATGLPGLREQICEIVSDAIQEPFEVDPGLNLIETLRLAGHAASLPIVLFFDQFEELFIFHDSKTRRCFADDLSAIPSAKLNVKVIIGVRQDFLAQLSELEHIVEGLFDNRFWLRRMSRENAVLAVVQACSTCDVKIEPQLADSILQRLDPNSQGIELPYLQVVMDRLYRQAIHDDPVKPKITTEKVDKLGDIANILGTFLIEEVGKLPSPDTGRQILKAFVTREKTRRTLDREAIAQEAAGFGQVIPPDVLDAHLNQLVSVRVLREFAENETYELRHDALAATVAGWISEVEQELIEVRDNLINRFKEYEARGGSATALLDQSFIDYMAVYRKRLRPLLNDEQTRYLQESEERLLRASRIRQLAILGGVAAVLFVVIGIGLIWQQKARREKEQAARAAIEKKVDAQLERLRTVDGMLKVAGEDTLKEVPQMASVLAGLLQDQASSLQEFDAGNEESQYETARAFFNAGQVNRITGQDTEQAKRSFDSAIDLLVKLVRENPDNPEYQRQLGLCHMWLGELFRNNKELKEEPGPKYEKAFEIQLKLAENGDVRYEIDLARSYLNRGIHRDISGLPKEAQADFEKAEDLLKKSLKRQPDGSQIEEARVLLSKTYINHGVTIKLQLDKVNPDKEQLDKAKEFYEKGIEELGKVTDNSPDQRLEYKELLAMSHNNLANLLEKDPNQKERAKSENSKAIHLGELINVGTPQVRIELAKFYNTKALLIKDQDKEGAIEQWEKAVRLLDTVLMQNPKHATAKKLKDKYEDKIDPDPGVE